MTAVVILTAKASDPASTATTARLADLALTPFEARPEVAHRRRRREVLDQRGAAPEQGERREQEDAERDERRERVGEAAHEAEEQERRGGEAARAR